METTQKVFRSGLEFIGEIKVNKSNKELMVEKILSYSTTLQNGIKKYKEENFKFTVFILCSVLFINFPELSLPCCFIATFFLLRMLQLIKYRSIHMIVNNMAKDLAHKGVYNKGSVGEMIKDFKSKYGEDIIEYYELVYMVNEYEAFVVKIEEVIKNMHNEKQKGNWTDEYVYGTCDDSLSFKESYKKDDEKTSTDKDKSKLNPDYSLLYKNEDGEIKKVNRAIEFFDDKSRKEDAVVLKGGNKKDKNLTVYLYKKTNELQDNVL
ncbi:hypothetical protein ACTQ31_18595 [Clostridium butyricum]|uniref:hypothetical protein n=1 Tax=Clostridium butyricum TaxID=1492 RepID=UPI003F9213F2